MTEMPVAMPQNVPSGRATIAAAPDDDMAGHGHQEFKDAAAQKPASDAFEQGVGSSDFGEAAKNDNPDHPEKDEPVITS